MPFDGTNYKESSLTTNLRKARAILEKGWCAGIREDYDGSHCALGALDVVLGGMCGDYSPEVQQLAKFSKVKDNRASYAVAMHNNTRGKEATLLMFDQAIADSLTL